MELPEWFARLICWVIVNASRIPPWPGQVGLVIMTRMASLYMLKIFQYSLQKLLFTHVCASASACVCVCAYVRACVRARARAIACVCVDVSVCVCVCVLELLGDLCWAILGHLGASWGQFGAN